MGTNELARRETLENLEEFRALRSGDRVYVIYKGKTENTTLDVVVWEINGDIRFLEPMGESIRQYIFEKDELGFDRVGKMLILPVDTKVITSGEGCGYSPLLIQAIKMAGFGI
ncbi:MAG: hypothetical protein WC548_02695 [Candidatus Pacearchaeota archaeon]